MSSGHENADRFEAAPDMSGLTESHGDQAASVPAHESPTFLQSEPDAPDVILSDSQSESFPAVRSHALERAQSADRRREGTA
jgi:hypothetical protein